MANEILDGTDVICQLLGEGERFSDQPRDPLSQRTVESLDVIGYPLLLFDHPMLLLWNDTFIGLPSICIESCMSPVVFWYQLPKGLCTYPTAISNMECDDLPT